MGTDQDWYCKQHLFIWVLENCTEANSRQAAKVSVVWKYILHKNCNKMREWGKMSMGEPTEQKPIKVIHQVMSHWKSGKHQHAKMFKYICFCKIVLLAEIN